MEKRAISSITVLEVFTYLEIRLGYLIVSRPIQKNDNLNIQQALKQTIFALVVSESVRKSFSEMTQAKMFSSITLWSFINYALRSTDPRVKQVRAAL